MKNLKLKFISIISTIILVFTCINCQKGNIREEAAENLLNSPAAAEIYTGLPRGKQVIQKYFGKDVTFEEINGEYLLGDIIFTEEQVTKSNNINAKGTIIKTMVKHWPKVGNNYEVPYTIDDDLPNINRVLSAIAHWEAHTKLRFVLRRDNQPDYIRFRRSDDMCKSSIGKKGGVQSIFLADACTIGNTIHEMGHAIGLFHEQSHPKYNNYITVNYQNINPDYYGNFYPQAPSSVRTNKFNFKSIMMYGSYFFSKNGLPTIVRKDGSTFSVQRDKPSGRDIKIVNKIYN
ncbi:M12 family metallopeptidase [Aquimarina algiphila]|uniref:M12 family metallopeptidase n=1 Tax=Aquimarina algiphila TaxID=2047982 RepID=UPI00232DC9B6|nr:M12 family metallopeptidase [Aquimarina algiphila]